jgi:hypothetical protein
MGTVPLNEPGSVTLNGSGNGTLRMRPYGGSETWLPGSVSFKASSNALEASCRIYIGPSPTDQYFVDGSLSGSTGDSTGRVAGYKVDSHGNYLWAVWAGGDAGATATMQVTGTEVTPGSGSPFDLSQLPAPGSGCSNPIIGGGGALVYPSIHSPNFSIANPAASPSPSWAILKSGLAYFFGLVLSGGTITGPDYIFDPTGLFFYSGTPGAPIAPVSGSVNSPGSFSNLAGPVVIPAGTYLVSWSVTLSGILAAGDANNCGIYHNNTFITGSINPAAAGTYPQTPVPVTIAPGDTLKILNSNAGTAGSVYGASFSATGNLTISLVGPGVTTDPKGSTVIPDGLTIYGSAGQNIFLGIAALGAALLKFFSGSALEGLPAEVISAISGSGAGQFLQLAVDGPSLNVAGLADWFSMQVASSNQGGTTLAEIIFTYVNNAQAALPILNINNLGLGLFNTAAPAALGGRTGIFSLGSILKFISGNDGNIYNTGRLTIITTGPQTINATGLAQVGNLTANIGPGQYAFRFWVPFNENAAAGAPSANCSSSNAGTGTDITFRYTKNGVAPVYASQPFNVAVNGPAMTAQKQLLEIEGTVTFPSFQTIALQMATTVAADTFIIPQGAKLEIWPV